MDATNKVNIIIREDVKMMTMAKYIVNKSTRNM